MRGMTRSVALVVCASLLLVLPAAAGKKAKSKDKEEEEGAGQVAGQVVAEVGQARITLDEVDAKARLMDAKPYQALYEARRLALEELVAERLFELEAAARGLSRDALVEQEVNAKVQPVTDADIEGFYKENQARMRGRSLEDSKAPIEQHLATMRLAEARKSFLDELQAKTGVRKQLEPPRVEVPVAQDEPRKGPAGAPVQIVEYSDFQCPYCSRVGATLKQITEKYGDQVQILFRDFPLPFHNRAQAAAEAAQCAHEQGKFWEYHDLLFSKQNALEAEQLKQYAAELGLDATRFGACLDQGSFAQAVKDDHSQGGKLGVSGTPAFFINGRFLSGAQPYEAFARIIDEELELQAARK
jgi:protein-disulfide isomerase